VRRARIALGLPAAVGAVLAGCSAGQPPAAPQPTPIQVSLGACGQGWSHPRAGQQEFTLSDTDSRAGAVYLTDAASGAVYSSVDPLGPGGVATMRVTLGGGTYAFRCAMEDSDVVVGPPVRVDGASAGQPPVRPVSQADLIEPDRRYQAYVLGRLPALAALTGTLRADIRRGDLAAARRDWLPAHLAYERLGAAYGAFGEVDGTVNGLPNGLPGGVRDPGFTGFHRIEYGLWHGQPAASLTAPADALAAAVAGLRAQFERAQLDPLEVSIRAHEITENALQFELTGQSDFGSGSNLATVRANLDGTRQVLAILRPLLEPRYPGLRALDAALDRTQHDLDAQHAGGRWLPLAALDRTTRERIDADVSDLSERLAPVAAICEPRRVS
jgi:iron uptake system component EfeO